MKIFKKNQVIIYVIALMLVTAGYLNYTTNDTNNAIQSSTVTTEEELDQMANIGDAQLVNSNDIHKEENKTNEENDTIGSLVQNDSESLNNINSNNIENVNEIQSVSDNNTLNSNQNYSVNNNSIETSSTNSKKLNNSDDYFTNSKLERDKMFSQILETYEKVLNSSNSLETQKQSATDEITRINNVKNSIMICENLIQTKGFENCVIFVNGDSISVVVKDDDLVKEEVAQVQNIISREMGAKVENIHISNR